MMSTLLSWCTFFLYDPCRKIDRQKETSEGWG